MNRYLNLVTLIAGLWWSSVLFSWSDISDAHTDGISFELTGAEISQTLVLTPAIVILVSLIARYRKIPRQIMIFAAVVAGWSGYLAVNLNPAASPAAIAELEKLTGVASTVGIAQNSIAPVIYMTLALLVTAFSLIVAFRKPGEKISASLPSNEEPTDPKSLWDSQN